MKYLVNMGISTRKSPNPDNKDWDVFIDYQDGDIVNKFPAHVPVEELIMSGHLSVIEDEKNISGAEEETEPEG